jgi:hypothetical protein
MKPRPSPVGRDVFVLILIGVVFAPLLVIGIIADHDALSAGIIALYGSAMLLFAACAVVGVIYLNHRASRLEYSDGRKLFRYSPITRWSTPSLMWFWVIAPATLWSSLSGTSVGLWLLGISLLFTLPAVSLTRRAVQLRPVRFSEEGLELALSNGTWGLLPWSEIQAVQPASPHPFAGPGIQIVALDRRVSIFRSIRGFRILVAHLRERAAEHGIHAEGVDWNSVAVFVEADRVVDTA